MQTGISKEIKNRILKIPMNRKGLRSQDYISRNTRGFNIFALQSGHANSGSSESDLVSGKMKKQ